MATDKYGVPALISIFIPGLGQIVKGQFFKGFLIWIVLGFVSFFFGWTYILPFAVWAWNIYDAYNN